MSVKEPINLKDLMESGTILNVEVPNEDAADASDEERECAERMMNYLNMEIAGEEEGYMEGQPFEIIASKMTDLVKGKVKKRVLRKGYGDKPSNLSIVRVHYNAYIEYQAEPFDSTYARKNPQQFNVGNGEVIIGLDIGVSNMQLNEKSQILILDPEYAYGKLGCLNRVPPNSQVLFEIELLDIVNVGAATTFHNLPKEEQNAFSNIYNYCLALCAKGKDLYVKNIKGAIKEYNIAVGKLETAILQDCKDEEKQQDLLLRLYSNLLVCYTKIEEPKKGCMNFNKIQALTKGTAIKIPAKCYFNNAKCLRMLGEFKLAQKRLDNAYNIEPKNPEILNEMILLEQAKTAYDKKEAEIYKAMLENPK